MIEMLTNPIMVILSQCISESNHPATHLKFTQCYVSIVSQQILVGG